MPLLLVLPATLGASCFTQDYDQAVEEAWEQQHSLLLFFNNSEASELGMKMKREILETAEFEAQIGSHFVCVDMDVAQAKNSALQTRFGVTQLPTLVLLDAEEHMMASVGYCSETPSLCARDLLNLEALHKQLQQQLAHLNTLSSLELCIGYASAQELQNQEAMHQILNAGIRSDAPGFFLVECYTHCIAQGCLQEAQLWRQKLQELDPQNHLGYLYQLALVDFQSLAQRSDLSPEQVIAPLTTYLEKYGSEGGEQVWRLEMMIAEFYLDQDCWPSALRYAEIAYREAPVERHADMEPLLRYIRDQAAQIASNLRPSLHN